MARVCSGESCPQKHKGPGLCVCGHSVSHHCHCHCPLSGEAAQSYRQEEETEVWELETLVQGHTANCCSSSLTPKPRFRPLTQPHSAQSVPESALSPHKDHLAAMPGQFP